MMIAHDLEAHAQKKKSPQIATTFITVHLHSLQMKKLNE